MKEFSKDFQVELKKLMKWRRDVRHFNTDPIPTDMLLDCLNAFQMAPSVGLSEPWRIVRVTSQTARMAALDNFRAANADALAGYAGDKAQTYAGLKLSGMSDAPEQIAVFCDDGTTKGAGLGAKTMPEMRRYSVVSAIMSFWLTLRAHGLGLGWVSILDPVQMRDDLDVPETWHLVAYLCIGWPKQDTLVPELENVGWEERQPDLAKWIER
jgi:5,6-dimethylbenzimidazole synthase